MKNNQEYLDELSEIRQMMEKASRFLSLSGLSGVVIGGIALAGAAMACILLGALPAGNQEGILLLTGLASYSEILFYLFLDAVLVLALSLLAGLWFSWRKAKKKNLVMWSPAARNMILSMAFPLVAGGILSLILFFRGDILMVLPLQLIFYGLALVAASRYTFPEIRSLGMAQTALGLLAALFPGLGLLFWAIGFGIGHMAYGIGMYLKYER